MWFLDICMQGFTLGSIIRPCLKGEKTWKLWNIWYTMYWGDFMHIIEVSVNSTNKRLYCKPFGRECSVHSVCVVFNYSYCEIHIENKSRGLASQKKTQVQLTILFLKCLVPSQEHGCYLIVRFYVCFIVVRFFIAL